LWAGLVLRLPNTFCLGLTKVATQKVADKDFGICSTPNFPNKTSRQDFPPGGIFFSRCVSTF
jgi:hypothetical protein